MENTIVFFDFDGTITRGDSFAIFLKFILGNKFYAKVASNLLNLISYKMGIIDNSTAKARVLKSCLGGMEYSILIEKCNEFIPLLESICKESALQKMSWHKDMGHKISLVSASFEEYLRPLCNKWGIDVIATKMEVSNGIISGNLATSNCYGAEKVRRINEIYDIESFSSIYVYGDTRGDKEMLMLASEEQAFFRVFN